MVIFFNVKEAREYLLSHGHVYTLRASEHARAGDLTEPVTDRARWGGWYKFQDLGPVRIEFVRMIRNPMELQPYVAESGFGTVFDWVKNRDRNAKYLLKATRLSAAYEKEDWRPGLGDVVEFVGKQAKSMEFPQGTVHHYMIKGHRGRAVAYIGNDLVVRTERGVALPGHGYGDYWAPVKEWKLISKGTGIEPPHVPPPGPWGSDEGVEKALQRWAESRGLPPIPKFDIEKFVQQNPLIREPSREGWAAAGVKRKMLGLFVGFEKVSPYLDMVEESPGKIASVEEVARLAGFKEAPSVVSGRAVGDLASDEDFGCWSRLRAAVPVSLRDRVYVYDGPNAVVYALDVGGQDFKVIGLIRKVDGKTPPCG